MLIWQGQDLATRDAVIVYDTPLRVLVQPLLGDGMKFEGEQVVKMAICTSMTLGTAAVFWMVTETPDEFMVIEAINPDDRPSGRYNHALQFAHRQIQEEIDVDRLWNSEVRVSATLLRDAADSDELLDKLIRDALRKR